MKEAVIRGYILYFTGANISFTFRVYYIFHITFSFRAIGDINKIANIWIHEIQLYNKQLMVLSMLVSVSLNQRFNGRVCFHVERSTS